MSGRTLGAGFWLGSRYLQKRPFLIATFRLGNLGRVISSALCRRTGSTSSFKVMDILNREENFLLCKVGYTFAERSSLYQVSFLFISFSPLIGCFYYRGLEAILQGAVLMAQLSPGSNLFHIFFPCPLSTLMVLYRKYGEMKGRFCLCHS